MGRVAVMCMLLFFVGSVAAEETMYVTDKLFLGLYANPDGGGDAVTTLVSGTPLQVLERNKYYSRVRTAQGAEGWVKSAYLVEEKPPRLLLTELQTQRDQFATQLESTKSALSQAQQAAAKSEAQLETLQAERTQQRDAVARLQEDNHALRRQLHTDTTQVPLAWLVGVALGCLIVGAWSGYAWLDRRIRRRHGGFRIY